MNTKVLQRNILLTPLFNLCSYPMKPVTKAIIYDRNCPMCQAYTKGFVRWGLLSEENRIPFDELQPQHACRYMDLSRSRHEIPLVDLMGGQTLYGLDALLYLIGQRMPVFSRIIRIPLIYKAMQKFYGLISYNRRVITATASAGNGIDCAPDYHSVYRMSFIAVCIPIATLISWQLGVAMQHHFIQLTPLQILLACGSGWMVQMGAALLLLRGRQTIEYIGQLAVLMVIGTGVLLPGLWLDSLTGYQHIGWIVGSVTTSSLLMHIEHHRRIKYLSMSQLWTVGWSLALFSTAVFWLLYR